MKISFNTRQIVRKKLLNEGVELKHLRRRSNLYHLRQQKAPFKNSVEKSNNLGFFKGFLTLIGVLPIVRPAKKAADKLSRLAL